MEARELIIGRYYNASIEFSGSIEAKLSFNNHRDFLLTKNNLLLILQLDLAKWVNPIPLTEEWLLKFGFTKFGIEFPNSTFHLNKFQWSPWKEGVFVIPGNYTVHCKFVHQLQNLYFALTETELEILTK